MFLVSFALAGMVAIAPGPSQDVVDAAIVVAQAHAAAGDYDQALSTVREARQLSDHPDLIVVEAQILRLGGQCEDAVDLYREYIATEPPSADRAFAESNLEACQQTVLLSEADELRAAGDCSQAVPRYREFLDGKVTEEERRAVATKIDECEAESVEPVEPLQPVGPEPAPPAPATVVDDPRPRRDALGIALWTGGGVAVVAGAAIFGSAWGQVGRSRRDSPNLDMYLADERRARTLSGVGIAVMSAGAGVLITAAIRHVVRKRRSSGG